MRGTEHLQSNCCCRAGSTARSATGPTSPPEYLSAFTLSLPSSLLPLPPRPAVRVLPVRAVPQGQVPLPARRAARVTNHSPPRCPWWRSADLSAAPGPLLRLSWFARAGAPTACPAPVRGGGGSSPGLRSPPGDATPPGDAQTALIKKLNTASLAAAAASSSPPAPFYRSSRAPLSPPARRLNRAA